MRSPIPTKVLVVTDTTRTTPELLRAMSSACERATWYDVAFHLVVVNPAHAEIHPLHPRRHEQVASAEQVLRTTVQQLEDALGGARVTGSVSVRHDPMDAIEETLVAEPVHEIWLQVQEHALAKRLHQDLTHRLSRLDLPVRTVPPTDRSSPGRPG